MSKFVKSKDGNSSPCLKAGDSLPLSVDVYERDIVCKFDAYWERCYRVPGCSAVVGHVKIRSPGANTFCENRD